MRLIKEDKIIIASVVLVLCLHMAYVVSSALPDNAASNKDANNALPVLESRTVAVDDALMSKFSLLYGIEPATTAVAETETVETEQNFSTMQPRLLAVNIENNITTVLVLVTENAKSKQYALKAGDELFSYTLVEANLRHARFESESDSLTLNMFKSFVPAGTDEN